MISSGPIDVENTNGLMSPKSTTPAQTSPLSSMLIYSTANLACLLEYLISISNVTDPNPNSPLSKQTSPQFSPYQYISPTYISCSSQTLGHHLESLSRANFPQTHLISFHSQTVSGPTSLYHLTCCTTAETTFSLVP